MPVKNYLYVGVDVSLKSLVTCIVDYSGKTIFKPKSFENSPAGTVQILNQILIYADSLDVADIFIGIEATSNYGSLFLYDVADSNILKSFSVHCFCFEPKIIKNFRKTFGDLPKNDSKDSWVIANRLRIGILPNEFYVNFKQLGLQRLTRFRQHVVQSITREKTYLVSSLFLKFSTLCQKNVLSDNFGATAEVMLTDILSCDDIAAKPVDELIDIMLSVSRRNFKDVTVTAQALKNAAASSFKLNHDLNASVNIVLKSCFDNISALEKTLKSVESAIQKQVKELFKNEYTILLSVPGIGPAIAAGLIAEIGDINRFDSHSALAKFAGLVWSQYQSGEFEAEDTSLRKTGNAYLRCYFCLAANCMRLYSDDFKTFYTRKYSEVSSHQHKRALVLTARKAVRVIFALLHDNHLYIPPKKGVLPMDD